MRREIRTSVEVAATPDQVWQVLVAFDRYSEWNPFIVAADGTPEPGNRVTLTMRAGGKSFTVRPVVVARDERRALRWVGRLGAPGIFTAAHSHELERTDTGVRYVQRERFTGVLVPLLRKTLVATEVAFEAMNQALKRRVEEDQPGPA